VTIELGADEESEKERSVANTEKERSVVDGGKSAWNPAQCAIS
jgi:hypothetical protein